MTIAPGTLTALSSVVLDHTGQIQSCCTTVKRFIKLYWVVVIIALDRLYYSMHTYICTCYYIILSIDDI